MNTQDWQNALDWGWGAPLYVENYGGALSNPFTSAAAAAASQFSANAQNEQLVRDLGYTGPTTTDGAWDSGALKWLNDQGYSLGVGHERGSSAYGRPEYFGLMGQDYTLVDGQSDPSMQVSDSLLDNVLPMLMVALPAASAIATSAAAGGTAGLGAAAPSAGLSATPSSLSGLLSPAEMGLTAVTPSITTAELAALGAGIPEAVGGALGGAAAAATPTATLPTVTVTGSSAGASALPSVGQVATGAASAASGSSLADQLFQQAADEALASSDNYYNKSPVEQWAQDVSNVADLKGGSVVDYISSGLQNLPTVPGASSVIDKVTSAGSTGQNLAGIIGAIGGALDSGGTNTATATQQIDPRMAQYLYGTGYGDANSLLGAAQKYWTENKTGLNSTMQQGLDMQRAALTDPAYAQAFTQMRNVGTGLLSQPVASNPFTAQQPTAQAGGPGGLLTGNFQDRAKALMATGRGLLG